MNLVATQPIRDGVGTIPTGQPFEAGEHQAQQLIQRGMAKPYEPGRKWSGLDWPGATVVILASGPSLTVEQCEAVRAWRGANDARRVIAINTTFRRAPWADVLYACDETWWRLHIEEVRAAFRGELWAQAQNAVVRPDVHRVESQRAAGLGKRPGLIHQGGNSGYQAMNLAYQAGATRLILLGFDMHGTHWHGKHELGLTNTPPNLFKTWIENFDRLARDLAAAGVDVVNCTPASRLTVFAKADLTAALS